MTAMDVEQELFQDIVEQLDTPYTIVILDDDVTTMDYVVAVFVRHFKLELEVAVKKMYEVHNEGRSVLDSGTYDEMKAHHEAMMAYKLRSKIEKAT